MAGTGNGGAESMAAAKRALIVDDSRSARTFLSKILEKYDIQVDSAESAEQAIEYLGHHRPDVIFMDHMMPGMDGFQAVQAIKNNPRTATIPILMYTSQEGELYLGQARALGAVGVLPKQIKQADVSKVLYQLHLLPDRRMLEQSTFRPMSVVTLDDIEGAERAAAARALTDVSLREHLAELRRVLVASLDSQSERLSAELRRALQDNEPTAAAMQPRARAAPWAWVAAASATIIALVAVLLWTQERQQNRSLAAELARLQRPQASLGHDLGAPGTSAPGTSAPGTSAPGTSAAGMNAAGSPAAADLHRALAPADLRPAVVSDGRSNSGDPRALVVAVPYGEEPLSGARLDAVRDLFDRLANQGYRGVVEIRTYPGRFCLMGNASDGYSLAPDETTFGKCDLVGSVPDDPMTQPQRVSLAFAELLAQLRNRTHGAVEVQIASADPSLTAIAYPPISDALTAGEWNRAGAANNRLEVRVR